MIRRLTSRFLINADADSFHFNLANTATTEFSWKDDRYSLRSLNDVSHLTTNVWDVGSLISFVGVVFFLWLCKVPVYVFYSINLIDKFRLLLSLLRFSLLLITIYLLRLLLLLSFFLWNCIKETRKTTKQRRSTAGKEISNEEPNHLLNKYQGCKQSQPHRRADLDKDIDWLKVSN